MSTTIMATQPSFLDTLKREAGSAVDSITGIPAGLKQAFTAPPTADENAEFGGDTSGAKRVGLGLDRLLIKPVQNAASDYAHGRVSTDAALSVAPEALGTAAGTVVGGKVLDTALAGEHPQIAAQAASEHANTGGSTFDPTTGKNLAGSKNIAVGIAPEHSVISEHPVTPQQYSEFVAQHRDFLASSPNTAVGTHFDPATGLHHMELVGLTPSKMAASDMASQLGESYTYNLATDEKIPTGMDPNARPLAPASPTERAAQINAASPQREPYSGTHYSTAQIDMIDGARRGSSGGAEAARTRLGTQSGLGDDAPAGYYTYKSGSLGDASMAGRQRAYQVRGKMAFATTDSPEFQNGYAAGVQKASAAGADAQTAHQLGLNAAEKAVQDAGYDGYYSPKYPNTRFHFGSEPAVPLAPKEAPPLDLGSYGPPKADFKGKVPLDNLGFDFSPSKDYGDAARADVEKRMGGPLPRGLAERRDPLTAAQWPEQYRNGAQMLDSTGAGGANYTSADLAALKAKHGIPDVKPVATNGSGESSASMEAINRMKAERAQGIQRFRVDTRSGVRTPLIGPDAADAQAGPYDVIMQSTPQGDIELDRGQRARPMK